MNEKIREMWQDVYDRLEADDLAVADDVVDGEGPSVVAGDVDTSHRR